MGFLVSKRSCLCYAKLSVFCLGRRGGGGGGARGTRGTGGEGAWENGSGHHLLLLQLHLRFQFHFHLLLLLLVLLYFGVLQALKTVRHMADKLLCIWWILAAWAMSFPTWVAGEACRFTCCSERKSKCFRTTQPFWRTPCSCHELMEKLKLDDDALFPDFILKSRVLCSLLSAFFLWSCAVSWKNLNIHFYSICLPEFQ